MKRKNFPLRKEQRRKDAIARNEKHLEGLKKYYNTNPSKELAKNIENSSTAIQNTKRKLNNQTIKE